MAQTADLLGRPSDAAYYTALAAEVRAAFARAYVTPAGRLVSDATTAYALARHNGVEIGKRDYMGKV